MLLLACRFGKQNISVICRILHGKLLHIICYHSVLTKDILRYAGLENNDNDQTFLLHVKKSSKIHDKCFKIDTSRNSIASGNFVCNRDGT